VNDYLDVFNFLLCPFQTLSFRITVLFYPPPIQAFQVLTDLYKCLAVDTIHLDILIFSKLSVSTPSPAVFFFSPF
jgi:hypothetical protein